MRHLPALTRCGIVPDHIMDPICGSPRWQLVQTLWKERRWLDPGLWRKWKNRNCFEGESSASDDFGVHGGERLSMFQLAIDEGS